MTSLGFGRSSQVDYTYSPSSSSSSADSMGYPSSASSSASSVASMGHLSHYGNQLDLPGGGQQRDFDNSSPRSVCSLGSGYGSYYSPSPRTLDTPSPPTPASASKLYNLLKNPNSCYNTVDTWKSTETFDIPVDEHGALNLKRKAEEPMDLSYRPKKHRTLSEDSLSEQLCSDSVSSRLSFSQQSSSDEGYSGSILESMLSGKVSSGLTAHSSVQAWDKLDDTKTTHLTPPSASPVSLPGNSSFVSPPSPFSSASSTCSSPSFVSRPVTSGHNHRVRLAKKVLLPVTARVSDWIVKIANFGQSLPEFVSLSHTDKMLLILNSWSRILLLSMAENGFQFAVTPVHEKSEMNGEKEGIDNMIKPEEIPTMHSVDQIQSYIKKLQRLGLDSKEYYYLKMVTLFASASKLESPKFVDNVNTCARQALQEHIRASPSKSRLRYSQLLLCLPQLYTINCKMMENLFCRHLTDNTDIELLLKEMIQKL